MRSYHAHLKQQEQRPVYRSSAIFPVLQRDDVFSRILFLGYWFLKRNIPKISSIITLRSEDGTIINRKNVTITEPRCYRIECSDFISDPFQGSMEVEFFSNENLVFPYPAVVINYYGPHFSSVVHTAQRIYNDYEDMQKNSESTVPESGFNIYADRHREPFLGLINGAEPVINQNLSLTFYNTRGDVLDHQLPISLQPYETRFLYPGNEVNLSSFLKGKEGTMKVVCPLRWIFPRMLCGNFIHDLPAMTITHSYYDCTQATTESDYWTYENEDWYPASLMIPLLCHGNYDTKIYFYPIYSPSKFVIDIEVYDTLGNITFEKKNILAIDQPTYSSLSFKDLIEHAEGPLAARIIARPVNGSRFPARIKIAVDIGTEYSCNICTNLQPYYPPFDKKAHSFKWCPILADTPHASCWIMNSSPSKESLNDASMTLSYYREQDQEVIHENFTLPPHGFTIITPQQSFFNEKIGWITLKTSNPYTTMFYFTESDEGVMGGDHCF